VYIYTINAKVTNLEDVIFEQRDREYNNSRRRVHDSTDFEKFVPFSLLRLRRIIKRCSTLY